MSYIVFFHQPRNGIDLDSTKPNDDSKNTENAVNVDADVSNNIIDVKNEKPNSSVEDRGGNPIRKVDKHEQPQEKTKDGEKGSSYLTMYGEHRVKPALEKLPKWLSDYFAWHQEQVANANGETKYLVVTCLGLDRKCGGFSDRLRGLPFQLLVASKVKRVLCIYWSKPFGLEHLMKPPKGGMDWRCPTVFDSMVVHEKRSRNGQPFIHNLMFGVGTGMNGPDGNRVAELLITKIKKNHDTFTSIGYENQAVDKIDKANNVFNAYSYRERMPVADKWFHVDLSEHIYRVMFEPVEPIAQSINATMSRLGLVENNYTAVHVRGRYPTRGLHRILGVGDDVKDHDKGGHEQPFEGLYKEYLLNIANNALECGALLDRDSQLFFISDSADLTNYVTNNPIMLGEDKKSNNPGRTYQPISFGEREEIKHLGASIISAVEHADFYPIIEDLLIMGGSHCVSHGIGSFGAFGASLSGNRCRALHRDYMGGVTKCPNTRELKFIVNVTDSDLMFGDKVSDSDGRLDPALGYFYEDEEKLSHCYATGCNLSDAAFADMIKYTKVAR